MGPLQEMSYGITTPAALLACLAKRGINCLQGMIERLSQESRKLTIAIGPPPHQLQPGSFLLRRQVAMPQR